MLAAWLKNRQYPQAAPGRAATFVETTTKVSALINSSDSNARGTVGLSVGRLDLSSKQQPFLLI
jgi:hypothetical protein